MKKSSKIMLIACGVIAVSLAAYYIPVLTDTQPQMSEHDAAQMLERLSDAFYRKNDRDVISFAFDDAKVAGQKLQTMHEYLKKAFVNVRDLDVRFSDMRYSRDGERVKLDTFVTATDKSRSTGQTGETYYRQPVTFTVDRRAYPHLLGLVYTFEWKISEVEAPNLPSLDKI